MLELGAEEGDLLNASLDIVLVGSTGTDDHAEGVGTVVIVQSTNAMVLALSDVLHEVVTHIHPLVVEEDVSIEGTVNFVGSEVGCCRLAVVAEVLTIALSGNPGLSNEFSDVGGCLSAKRNSEDLWAETSELALVLHESSDTTLLIPDKEVLACCLGGVNDTLKVTEGVSRP